MNEESQPRRTKLLTNPDKLKTRCVVCSELGNLENLLRHQLPCQNKAGQILPNCYTYLYFCSENCRLLFRPD